MMGETLAQTICKNKIEYKPGNWFNPPIGLILNTKPMGGFFLRKTVPLMKNTFNGNIKMILNASR